MIDIKFLNINFHLIKLMIIRNNNRIFKTIVNEYNYDLRSEILSKIYPVNEAVKTRHHSLSALRILHLPSLICPTTVPGP